MSQSYAYSMLPILFLIQKIKMYMNQNPWSHSFFPIWMFEKYILKRCGTWNAVTEDGNISINTKMLATYVQKV